MGEPIECAYCCAEASLEISPVPNPKRVPGIAVCADDKHIEKAQWRIFAVTDNNPGYLPDDYVESADEKAWVERWKAAAPCS